jgi:cytochrome c-type biogenesis protein CcmH/NrfG
MSYFALVLVIAAIAFIGITEYKHSHSIQTPSQLYPWRNVDAAFDQLNYPKAISLAQAILTDTTNNNDGWGYLYLGNIYLRMGNLTNAEAAYERAYRLFPSKTHEEKVTAIQKRIAMEHNAQSQSK